MDVLVVARRPQARWAAAAALGLPAAAACAPALAASRLAHPSSPRPQAVLLLVHDESDVAWLRQQGARCDDLAVVAVTDAPRLVAAVRAAGATVVLGPGADVEDLADGLRAATGPAVVIDLDAVRSA